MNQLDRTAIIRTMCIIAIVIFGTWSMVMYYNWSQSHVDTTRPSSAASHTMILTNISDVYGKTVADKIIASYKNLTSEAASLAVVRPNTFTGLRSDQSFLIDSTTSDATYKITISNDTIVIDCPDTSERQSTAWICPIAEAGDS